MLVANLEHCESRIAAQGMRKVVKAARQHNGVSQVLQTLYC